MSERLKLGLVITDTVLQRLYRENFIEIKGNIALHNSRYAMLERGWARIDFHVLDWNPARGFYQKLGFDHLEEWLRYGAAKGWLERLAAWDEPD